MNKINPQKVSVPEQESIGKELYELRKQQKKEAKKQEQRREKVRQAPRKMKRYLLYAAGGAAVVAVIIGIAWWISGQSSSSLPPVTMEGHIEASPSAHILDEPMPESIQKHMLEHADGGGPPGIIIQYNCEDFECDPDLIPNLAELVEQSPVNVYLAPNRYEGKIILTKLGEREILDSFDEQAIREFIEQ